MSRETVTAPSTCTPRFHKALAFLAARWPECGLALAMFAGVLVAGCHSHC